MPTLPPINGQVARGINGRCIDCNLPIDRRSKRCRECHIRLITKKRYVRRRLVTCSNCGAILANQSRARRMTDPRCQTCYNINRIQNPRPKRSVDRPIPGTCYVDEAGSIRWATEYLGDGTLTVASAWASLRRCWKGFKIAKSQGDHGRMAEYARAIQKLQSILNISRTDFPELMLDKEQEPSNLHSHSSYGDYGYSEDGVGAYGRYHPPFTCPSGT